MIHLFRNMYILEIISCDKYKINTISLSDYGVNVLMQGFLPALWFPRNSPGKNTGVGCHFFLQGTFPTQGYKPGLLHCRQLRSHLSHQRSPFIELRHRRKKKLSTIYQ